MTDAELLAWFNQNRHEVNENALDFIWWPIMTEPDDPFVSEFPHFRERVLVLHALIHSPTLTPTQRQRATLALEAARFILGQYRAQ